MLDAIGVASIDELFADIPEALRLGRPLALDRGLSEQEVYEELQALAARNVSTEDEISFLGAGMYDHYVPALVDSIIQRSEFLTPYTPYQPEISQGGLQAMFEYQTAISELTGLPVSNASVYEGPSAVAAAGYVAKLANGRGRFVISRGVHPHARETLATLAHAWEMELVEAPLRDGVTELPSSTTTSARCSSSSRTSSARSRTSRRSRAARHEAGALTICRLRPAAAGAAAPPGECGVDIAVGEGQTLGNRLDFGGPSFGFFAATEALMRRMPGRIAGQTTDLDGKRGFVLTLQTREQHIRRERATSNICTAQALNALAGVIYLSWLGPARDRRARRADAPAHRLRPRAAGSDRRRHRAARPAGRPRVRGRARRSGRARCSPAAASRASTPATRSGATTPSSSDGLLVAITERRTRADIDRLADVLGAARWRPSASRRDEPRGARHDPRRRRRADDLRALRAGPARVRAAGARRPRAPARRAAPARLRRAASRRGCPRSPSPRSSATTTACRSGTSTSTPASTRSARAR